MSRNIVAYRLINGDEIIANKVDHPGTPEDQVILEKVRHLIVQRTVEGLGVTLMPWAFSNIDAELTLNKSAILAYIKPNEDTIKSYTQQTTNIQLL